MTVWHLEEGMLVSTELTLTVHDVDFSLPITRETALSLLTTTVYGVQQKLQRCHQSTCPQPLKMYVGRHVLFYKHLKKANMVRPLVIFKGNMTYGHYRGWKRDQWQICT